MFHDPVEKRRINVSTTDQVTTHLHAIITLVLGQDAWHTVLGITRYVQIISLNVVARTMANPYCCYEVVYRLGAVRTHQQFVADKDTHHSPNYLSIPKKRCHLNTNCDSKRHRRKLSASFVTFR